MTSNPLLMAVFLVLLSTATGSPQSLEETLLAIIRPSEHEQAWQRIPWQTELWEARRIATETGKPIFLWEMDGNPLGCT